MFMSLIICTKDRAEQLRVCLEYLAAAAPPPCDMDVIMVDNGSTDATASVIAEFAAASPFKVTTVRAERPGLGLARNVGLAAAKGEWLLFTDDDCYVEKQFFRNFFDFVTALAKSAGDDKNIRYGTGQVIPYDDQHDPRIARLVVDAAKLIQPRSLMAAGTVQGANMFYHRSVFNGVGRFNERMGAGTPFACEDIEMAARASIAGFLGAQVPFFTVTHHHRRMIGSPEAEATVESYDFGRGAYYASLLERGVPQVWRLWEATGYLQHMGDAHIRARVVREFDGAAKYLAALSETIGRGGEKTAAAPPVPPKAKSAAG
jgi:glycosyltransferase involved in cell wall biosynthesis